jgi:hypothetical protein
MTLRLRDVLTAPFVLRSESVEREDGSWVRVLSYPELGCSIAGLNMLVAMDQLELDRVRTLVRSVERGTLPRTLRRPVPDVGLEETLQRAGLGSWVPRLDDPLSS